METTSFEPGRGSAPPHDVSPSRRISAEQMAAVNRLQAYWMARVGQRVAPEPLDSDSDFGDAPDTDDRGAN